ncbi:MAG TPA: flagellar basal body rod protein FlgB [Pseudolabrys sp.]|jgi:flagellar basal-body rod protein FlgB|nr:flagellar basal body rod protein FlgB [Pseudolabrys sp.]
MAISDIPILSMLRTRLEWAQARQKVLAENVANADTPTFHPSDLIEPKFGDPSDMTASITPVSLARTESGHIAGFGSTGGFHAEADREYELHQAGNTVNLEDQMLKVAANQMDYASVSALYTRSLNLIKTALGKH